MMNLLSSKTTLIVSLLLLLGIKINAQPGTIDIHFGEDGKVFYEPIKTHCEATAIQNDGKIIVTGYNDETDREKTGVYVVRFNTNGTIDNSFADNGKILINKADDAYTVTPRYLKIQQDGKIIIGVSTYNTNSYLDIGIIRLTKNGILDSSFHENGCLSFSLGPKDILGDMAILQNGKIILAGLKGLEGYEDEYESGYITRLLSNGNIDETFGVNGWVFDKTITDFEGFSMVIQGSNIILGGNVNYAFTKTQTTLIRYTIEGTKDKSFGSDGIATSTYPTYMNVYSVVASLNDIVLLPNNDLLIFSASSSSLAVYGTVFISLFNKDGVFDTTFGNGKGYLLPMPEIKSARVYTAQMIQADKIIGIGYKELSKGNSIAAFSFHLYGTLDSSFGTNGITVSGFDRLDYLASHNRGAVLPNGDIIMSSSFYPTYDEDYTRIGLIKLKGFTGITNENYVKIKRWIRKHGFTWSAAKSSKTGNYIVQRSSNGYDYTDIAGIQMNNSGEYSYEDPSPAKGNNYYRLSYVNENGKTIYTNSVEILDENNRVQIFPNPAADKINITGLNSGLSTVTVTDISGNIKIVKSIHANNASVDVGKLTTGHYILKITGLDNEIVLKQFFKK